MKLAFGTTGLDGDPSRSDGQQVLHAPRMSNRTRRAVYNTVSTCKKNAAFDVFS
tara:strand:+ start:363 stop:524 length:162 start_codon:yes stop_codon:yes gene_type:complete